MKNSILFFVGILIPTSIIQIVFIAFAIKYNYYSGINPYDTIFHIPFYIVIDAFIALVIIWFISIFKLKRITKAIDFFKFGFVLGFTNVGTHILFWVMPKHIELVVYAIVIMTAFFVALDKKE